MKIFFDTEFTGLHKNTSLISLGMIDENGRSFYAEFTDYKSSQVNKWIKDNVIAHLKHKGTKTETLSGFNPRENKTWIIDNKENIRNKLDEWLLPYDKVELVSDVCHYDMVLLIDLWGTAFDIPRCINPACHDINQDIASYYMISEIEAFDKSREEIIEYWNKKIKGDKHNSLYDAKVIREIYNIIEPELGVIE